MLTRGQHISTIEKYLNFQPITAILGPRQVGKTTLARQLASRQSGPVHWFDLEKPEDLARLNPLFPALDKLTGLVILDEAQRLPALFPVLRVLADRPSADAKFLLLGSASPDLIAWESESLAGRVAFHTLGGLSLRETSAADFDDLWLRGGFPRAFLVPDNALSLKWRRDFIETFLQRDLPSWGIKTDGNNLQRLWTMTAHSHGQIVNFSKLGSSLGVSDNTVRHYLTILQGAYMLRLLKPWHENLKKRQVKSPKLYLSDSGLLHALLNQKENEDILSHPQCGASWEGFLMEQIIQHLEAVESECFFWASPANAELDLLIVRGRKRHGFEFKRSDAPKLTASMQIALKDLKLDRLEVLHGGSKRWQMAPKIFAVPASGLLEHISM